MFLLLSIQTFNSTISLFSVLLNVESGCEEERTTEDAHETRDVQRVLQADELDIDISPTIR